MENNNIDFNTKLKNISKDLVASFFKHDNSQKLQKINDENNESSLSSNNPDPNFIYSEIVNQKSNDLYPPTTENNKANLTNSYKILLFTEQTTKSSVTNNYFPKNPRAKDTDLKTKINNNIIKSNKNAFILDLNKTFSFSATYSNFKEMQESKKEKKLYEEKIRLIHKHIDTLKQQQSYLLNKEKKEKEREKNRNKIKKEKEKKKQDLLSAEIDKRKEMETKRRNIAQKKSKEKKEMLISKEKIKQEKIKEYKNVYIEKKKIKNIIMEDNYKSNQINKLNIDKIKFERMKYRKKILNKMKNSIEKTNNSYRLTYRNNINETKKLKNKLMKLEKMEEEYIEKMKYTQINFKKNKIAPKQFNKHQKIKSFDNLNKEENQSMRVTLIKRNVNSLVKRYKINIENDISRNKINSLPKIKKDLYS